VTRFISSGIVGTSLVLFWHNFSFINKISALGVSQTSASGVIG
jgi:hypothetical protein